MLERNISKQIHETANFACKIGNLPFLVWLEEKGIFPDIKGANWSLEHGNLDVFKWLSNCRFAGYEPKRTVSKQEILPNTYGANFACNDRSI